VVGKGGKPRRIPVPDEFLDALVAYRRTLGLKRFPEPGEATPLVPDKSLTKAIGVRRIDQIVHAVFHNAAKLAEKKDAQAAERLRRVSAHWLRHSYGTCLAYDKNLPLCWHDPDHGGQLWNS